MRSSHDAKAARAQTKSPAVSGEAHVKSTMAGASVDAGTGLAAAEHAAEGAALDAQAVGALQRDGES